MPGNLTKASPHPTYCVKYLITWCARSSLTLFFLRMVFVSASSTDHQGHLGCNMVQLHVARTAKSLSRQIPKVLFCLNVFIWISSGGLFAYKVCSRFFIFAVHSPKKTSKSWAGRRATQFCWGIYTERGGLLLADAVTVRDFATCVCFNEEFSCRVHALWDPFLIDHLRLSWGLLDCPQAQPANRRRWIVVIRNKRWWWKRCRYVIAVMPSYHI